MFSVLDCAVKEILQRVFPSRLLYVINPILPLLPFLTIVDFGFEFRRVVLIQILIFEDDIYESGITGGLNFIRK